jgi:hypothetical protein
MSGLKRWLVFCDDLKNQKSEIGGGCGGYGRDGEDGGRTGGCILNAINPNASKKPPK